MLIILHEIFEYYWAQYQNSKTLSLDDEIINNMSIQVREEIDADILRSIMQEVKNNV